MQCWRRNGNGTFQHLDNCPLSFIHSKCVLRPWGGQFFLYFRFQLEISGINPRNQLGNECWIRNNITISESPWICAIWLSSYVPLLSSPKRVALARNCNPPCAMAGDATIQPSLKECWLVSCCFCLKHVDDTSCMLPSCWDGWSTSSRSDDLSDRYRSFITNQPVMLSWWGFTSFRLVARWHRSELELACGFEDLESCDG